MNNRLYTEEQVRQAYNKGIDSGFWGNSSKEQEDVIVNSLTTIELPSDAICVNCDEQKPIHSICMDCIIKIGKQNIELPSDEEISEVAMVVYGFDAKNVTDVLKYKAFKRGAKWMRDKIGGNNEPK